MHVFLSDIHLTDADAGGVVADSHLSSFLDRIMAIAAEKQSKKVTLVLVGDIFDLLRSEKWARLWDQNGSAPWRGMNPKFKHFKNSDSETTARKVLAETCARYQTLSQKIGSYIKAGKLETVYVPGNHDFMVQLDSDLRQQVVTFLGLTHDPKKTFPTTYSHKPSSVFALHGNAFDPLNWHREADGFWAIGDAIVLRIVNRFPEVACKAIGVNLSSEIGQLLQDIDNVQPLVQLPIWVRWITENNLSIKSSREEVIKAWKQVVDDFLSIKEFKDTEGYGSSDYKNIRKAFQLSTQLKLAELVANFPYLPDSDGGYRTAAEQEAKKQTKYRFVLFGHTHRPALQPLTYAPEGSRRFYVNTGCWRRLVMKSAGQGAKSFVARRVVSYFVADDDISDETQERYHLYQEWHTT
jgi:UDP-2,3-diacylglucosamine pyrophosphatase LpxH